MARWRHQAGLIVGAVAWLLLLLALVTHHLGDPGFSTSGDGEPLRNKAGMVGAWVSDLGLFLFGYSVWWFVPVGLRAWLSSLAQAVRREDDAVTPAPVLPRAAFWVGLALLMAASCSLEWTRLYQWESRLPGHAGGVLGFTLGPLSSHWLGFAGSGVLWIAALVAGMSLALGFSWLALAEAHRHRHRWSARAPPAAEGAGRGPPHRRGGAGASASTWSRSSARRWWTTCRW